MKTYQEITGTLNQGAHPGSYNGQDAYNGLLVIDDVLGRNGNGRNALRTECGGGQRMPDKGNCNCVITEEKMSSIVRRLTPCECERLQAFPDGWTDIGEWMDTKGKKRKTSDAARYKALGNSIATVAWFDILQGIAERCPADERTLGSLFDGIGGFPLIWERICGGTAVWASEIEEFCIAVTKRHFGDK